MKPLMAWALAGVLLAPPRVGAGPARDDRRFSDTYVRTPAGWRYVFGQASIPLPPAP